ncbi:hypothetical protein B0T17DRAFT_614111 [Bombardia bombarda]|uniref:Uncharacterized protein n=1 Tax=Bombardia bombarda TaxID=252184 RepID=A0AA39X6F4_9PEZI|nr:hypothetical protein B0T17DRAFT_614111 [Bombardia bombarda]
MPNNRTSSSSSRLPQQAPTESTEPTPLQQYMCWLVLGGIGPPPPWPKFLRMMAACVAKQAALEAQRLEDKKTKKEAKGAKRKQQNGERSVQRIVRLGDAFLDMLIDGKTWRVKTGTKKSRMAHGGWRDITPPSAGAMAEEAENGGDGSEERQDVLLAEEGAAAKDPGPVEEEHLTEMEHPVQKEQSSPTEKKPIEVGEQPDTEERSVLDKPAEQPPPPPPPPTQEHLPAGEHQVSARQPEGPSSNSSFITGNFKGQQKADTKEKDQDKTLPHTSEACEEDVEASKAPYHHSQPTGEDLVVVVTDNSPTPDGVL